MEGKNQNANLPVASPPKVIEPKIVPELYFNSNPPLPFIVTSQNKTINFAFTVKNTKAVDTVHSYRVYLEENGQIFPIENGQLNLKKHESKSVTVSYALTNPIKQAKIVVGLDYGRNYIYFLVRGGQ